MNFVKGGEYLDTSPRHTYTSGKNLSQDKNVLLAQIAHFLFDQYYFLKLLVGPTFEFAKSLVSNVGDLEIWHTVTRTKSHFYRGDERTVPMPTLACPGHARTGMGMAVGAPPDFGRRRSAPPRARACLPCPPPHSPPPSTTRRRRSPSTAAAACAKR